MVQLVGVEALLFPRIAVPQSSASKTNRRLIVGKGPATTALFL
jgi:hypothetical protein